MKKVSDSLAGRSAVLELETLSFGEIFEANASSSQRAIVFGGFPELQSREDLDRNLYYQSYVSTYLERDVRSLLNIGQLRDFERFLRACAFRSGNLLNKSELARDVGISPTTANEWISVLQASNQVVLLEPWFNNKIKSLVKSPKIYISDTGLLCYLLRIEKEDDLLKSPLAGGIWETFVFSEIRKNQVFREGSWNVWYWRDKYGLEVDFLIEKGGAYNLIEAKLAENADARDVDKIAKVAGIIGESAVSKKSIVTRTQNDHPLRNGIYCNSIGAIPDLIL
jgi:predicted AAA+ superfamily ATPase